MQDRALIELLTFQQRNGVREDRQIQEGRFTLSSSLYVWSCADGSHFSTLETFQESFVGVVRLAFKEARRMKHVAHVHGWLQALFWYSLQEYQTTNLGATVRGPSAFVSTIFGLFPSYAVHSTHVPSV